MLATKTSYTEDFREGASSMQDASQDQIERAGQMLWEVKGRCAESWKQLDEFGQWVMLDAAGGEVTGTYGHPALPLYIEDMSDSVLQGTYGDRFRSESDGDIKSADDRISANGEGLHPAEGVFGEDPRHAGETCLYEYRHSHHHEQIARIENPQFQNLVDSYELTRECSGNVQGQRNPASDYVSHHNRLVESNVRGFTNQIAKQQLPESGEKWQR